MGNIARTIRLVEGFQLDLTVNRLIVKTTIGRAVRISIFAEHGTWSNSTFTIKIGCGVTARDFGTVKTIAAGGGDVLLTADEMKAVSEVWIERAGTVDSGVTAVIRVVEETETVPA